MKKLVVASVAAVSALMLTACGSATVDNNAVDPNATVAPLERGQASATKTISAQVSSTRRSTQHTASSLTREPQAANEGAQDRGAREVAQAPTPQVSGKDAHFVSALHSGGISTDGIEDQLIGAGQAACNPNDVVTVGAVAGQLVEQGRTQLSVEETAGLIDAQAQSNLC